MIHGSRERDVGVFACRAEDVEGLEVGWEEEEMIVVVVVVVTAVVVDEGVVLFLGRIVEISMASDEGARSDGEVEEVCHGL